MFIPDRLVNTGDLIGPCVGTQETTHGPYQIVGVYWGGGRFSFCCLFINLNDSVVERVAAIDTIKALTMM